MSKSKASKDKKALEVTAITPAASKTARKSKVKSYTKTLSKFDIAKIPPALKKSPVKLRDWLDLHIPWFIGPHVSSLEPAGGQRGTIITVHGAGFAANRADNDVTINGTPVPVLAASSNADSDCDIELAIPERGLLYFLHFRPIRKPVHCRSHRFEKRQRWAPRVYARRADANKSEYRRMGKACG
jgi:hypothetical protein